MSAKYTYKYGSIYIGHSAPYEVEAFYNQYAEQGYRAIHIHVSVGGNTLYVTFEKELRTEL